MLKLNYKNVDAQVIGEENGLNLAEEFANYKDRITSIIADLNKRKDKQCNWLHCMYLVYS